MLLYSNINKYVYKAEYLNINMAGDKDIELIFNDESHPTDWFRFEVPFFSPREGKSYVSREDASKVIAELGEQLPEAQFYRLHGDSGSYRITPVMDGELVKKLAEHRQGLIQAREYDQYISSTNPAAPLLGYTLSSYVPGV